VQTFKVTKEANMKERDEVDIARTAADAVVFILFMVALICLFGFMCVLYFFLWLIGAL
jgi:hypothetical protein